MATFSGADGKVTYDVGDEVNVRSWSVTVTGATPGGVHSSSSGWQDTYAGMRAWQGTFEFYQDAGTIQPLSPGDSANVDLVDGNANKYGGTIVVSEVSYANDIEGGELVSGTVTFVGDGVFAIT